MRGDNGRFSRPFGNCGLFAALAIAALLAGFLTIGFAPPAQALPSFARQTGQPCGTCHTDFPGLTPYGRRFKLLGYTTGGGQFRTTPFSSHAGSNARAELDKLRGYAKAVQTPANDGDKEWVPPISMMADRRLHPSPRRRCRRRPDPYNANDNIVFSPFSCFWGGAITRQYRRLRPGDLQRGASWQDSAIRSGTPGRGTIPMSALHDREHRGARPDLRHHRQQQSDRAGCVEYHAGLGLSLRRIHDYAARSNQGRSSRARSPRMSAASVPIRSSTTCFISN